MTNEKITELEVCRELNQALRDREAGFKARIAELEKQAVVWHKYPDEKPKPSHEYEVNIPVMIALINNYIAETDFADYNTESDTFWRYGTKYKGITYWAYLPEPPDTVCDVQSPKSATQAPLPVSGATQQEVDND